MQIKKIALSDFRNFKNKIFSFSKDTTLIVGDNASGKTNILEAIYLLATGKSFKVRVEEEMVDYSAELSRVRGIVNTKELSTKLEVVLTRGKIKTGEKPDKFQRVARKRLLVNDVGKRLVDFVGNFKVVLFAPQDLDLVTASPSIRRKFLNAVLNQSDREYRRSLLSYEKGLRQRNKLLINIRENLSMGSGKKVSRSQLIFWDKLIIKNGDYITACREKFIEFINQTKSFNSHTFSIKYDKSIISEARIAKYSFQEIAAGKTLVGPHRDDFLFRLKKNKRSRDLSRFGSRGEQRMGVLWLKIAELAFIEQETEEKPILLLDDIFSELDHEHRDIVMEVVGNQQTIITTADKHYIPSSIKVNVIELK